MFFGLFVGRFLLVLGFEGRGRVILGELVVASVGKFSFWGFI